MDSDNVSRSETELALGRFRRSAATGARGTWWAKHKHSLGKAAHQPGCLGGSESLLGLVALPFCRWGCRCSMRPSFLVFLAWRPGSTSPHHLVSEKVHIYQESKNLLSSRSDCEFRSYLKTKEVKVTVVNFKGGVKKIYKQTQFLSLCYLREVHECPIVIFETISISGII